MQISNAKPSTLVLALLLFNITIASLLNTHVYYSLETFVYKQYENYLLQVKEKMHKTFSDVPNNQWQRQAIKLGQIFDTECLLIDRTAENFSAENFKLLQLKQAQSGLIDINSSVIYYPLDKYYVAEIGPIAFTNWQTFLLDWFSWLCALIINLPIIYWYLTTIEKHKENVSAMLQNLPFNVSNDTQSIYENIKDLNKVMLKAQQENSERLILQRDLLHGVAHEFRSPMARIQFALEMLEETPEHEHDRLRRSMHTALEDLDKLVKELLYYAKLKDSEAIISLENVNLFDTCMAAIDEVKDFYPEVVFKLTTNEAAYLKGNTKLLKRLLINLLRNAGRFANEQCNVALVVTNDGIVITLEDDGMGIPPGKSSRIFEPFTRLDASRSRDSGGCGLGLAIVLSIVNKHHGTINLIEGQLPGACFKITLPSDHSQ
ncbi:ATP-binding protein [Colwellia psychrerythraea]|uniref:histidine kinase n=1 Tax=Colwellia psychrerythraea TaxID=28229 RepID=A0A099KNB2_COLPS|nr:ATP-binding protein [Colwellia psychrerythraea]KGJ92254.1 integral membrane sensor signal transduction histidine kinase [Colwellia psychrerythraea]